MEINGAIEIGNSKAGASGGLTMRTHSQTTTPPRSHLADDTFDWLLV